MPLNYSIVLLGNPRKPDDPKKAYARSQVSKELTLKGLSQRVAAQTTVSRADVSAVLISVVENMIEALRDGEQVDFGELGKFRLQATSRGADSAEVFTATNITGVNIQFGSRRRSEKDLQRYEFQSRTQPCIRTCRTPCRESRRDDGRPVEETERRRRERRRR